MTAFRVVASCVVMLAAAACGGGPGAPADRGAVVYATHCAACHGRDGKGVGRNPPLLGSATVAGDLQALVAWVMAGKRPDTLPPLRGLVVMPQYAWLGDEDLAAVITHVRSRFGPGQPAVTAGDVAAVRAAIAVP